MMRIVEVESSEDAAAAQSLFRGYRQFLEGTQSCGRFDFGRFDEEIASLPEPYANRNGDVLLLLVGIAPVGCIAYRASTENANTCEIKRLFVLPEFRGQGFARLLVAAALERAAKRGYGRVILDTDAPTMPGAHHIYLGFGFVPYAPDPAPDPGTIVFLERGLPCHQAAIVLATLAERDAR